MENSLETVSRVGMKQVPQKGRRQGDQPGSSHGWRRLEKTHRLQSLRTRRGGTSGEKDGSSARVLDRGDGI